jgi:hypothetical protein
MKFVQKNVPVIEACRFYDEHDFHRWADDWGFDFQYVGQDDIRFRITQTMAAEEWVTVRPGDWVIHGAFDFHTMDDKSFKQYYKRLDLE